MKIVFLNIKGLLHYESFSESSLEGTLRNIYLLIKTILSHISLKF